MSTRLHCDNCDMAGPEDRTVGWLRLEPIGIHVQRLDSEAGPFDFCTMRCLWEWSGGSSRAKKQEVSG